MAFSRDEQDEIRNYLLGQLSDDRQQNLEQRLMTNDEYLEELEIIEDELIDEYLEANAEKRRIFEEYFLNSPERLAKLRFARALGRRVPVPVPAPSPVRLSLYDRLRMAWNSSGWALRAATVSALVVVVAGLFWVIPPPPPRNFATLTLTISTSERSQGGDSTRITLPIQADALRLQLRLPESAPRAPRYRVDLLRATGESEKLVPLEQSDEAVIVELPANQISRGQYALNVYAIKPDGTEERIKGSFLLTLE